MLRHFFSGMASLRTMLNRLVRLRDAGFEGKGYRSKEACQVPSIIFDPT